MPTAETWNKREIVNISTKRQFTIPQEYFILLGFNNEAECFLRDGGLFIRPLHCNIYGSEFAEQILADLIAQGYEGQALLERFKENSRAIRPAVREIINAADDFAKSGEGHVPIDKLFGKAE